jgi:hypothetical protein
MPVMALQIQTASAAWAAFVLAALMQPLAGCAEGATHRVTGAVYLGPACAGPQRPGDDCRAPMVDTEVRLVDADGRVAARGKTDAEGHFLLAAPAGSYQLTAAGPGKRPRCPVLALVLPRDADRPQLLECDSGRR